MLREEKGVLPPDTPARTGDDTDPFLAESAVGGTHECCTSSINLVNKTVE
jgi:hypothetical protein